jgi:hypothetical protein
MQIVIAGLCVVSLAFCDNLSAVTFRFLRVCGLRTLLVNRLALLLMTIRRVRILGIGWHRTIALRVDHAARGSLVLTRGRMALSWCIAYGGKGGPTTVALVGLTLRRLTIRLTILSGGVCCACSVIIGLACTLLLLLSSLPFFSNFLEFCRTYNDQ